MSSLLSVQIYFDGGASPNPGKAYGSYEVRGSGSDYSLVPQKQSRIQFGDGLTNNEAEYRALLSALDWCNSNLTTAAKLEIFTDSNLVEGQLSGNWKCRKPHLMALMHEARALLRRYRHWNIRWRPRKFNVERFGH